MPGLTFFSRLPPARPQVEEELLEQEFLERCFQEMLEEEDQDWFIPSRDLNNQGVGQLQQQLNGLSVSDHHNNLEEVAVSPRHVTMHVDFRPGGFRSWSKAKGMFSLHIFHCEMKVLRENHNLAINRWLIN